MLTAAGGAPCFVGLGDIPAGTIEARIGPVGLVHGIREAVSFGVPSYEYNILPLLSLSRWHVVNVYVSPIKLCSTTTDPGIACGGIAHLTEGPRCLSHHCS